MRFLIVLRESKATIECSGCPSYDSERMMDLVRRSDRVHTMFTQAASVLKRNA